MAQPPVGKDLVLKGLNFDCWERIFSQLSIKDLFSFTRTCKDAKEAVGNFVSHYMASNGRRDMLQDFLNDLSVPLSPPEEALRQKLQSPDQRPDQLKELISLEVLQTLGQCPRREHVYKCENKSREQSIGFCRVFSRTLNRDVVTFKGVKWASFKKMFDNVDPGTYCFSVHVGFESLRASRAGECITEVTRCIWWPRSWLDAGGSYELSDHLVCIHSSSCLDDAKAKRAEYDEWMENFTDGNLTRDRPRFAWTFAELEPFTLKEKSRLYCRMTFENFDVSDEMAVDFIQLRKL